MKLDYFIACDYAVTDSVGRTAAIGIFDTMRLGSPINDAPFRLNRFYIAFKILGALIEGTAHQLSLVLRTPNDVRIPGPQFPLTLTAGGAFSVTSAEMIILVEGVELPDGTDGDYMIEIVVDGARLGSRTIHVNCPARIQVPTGARPTGPIH